MLPYLPFLGLPFALGDRPALLLSLAADPGSPDFGTLLVTYGPLGIFLLMLYLGGFRTKFEVQRLEKEIEKQDVEIKRLLGELAKAHVEAQQKDELNRAFQMQLTGHALPALRDTARVFEAIPQAETDLFVKLREAQEQLAALLKQVPNADEGDPP